MLLACMAIPSLAGAQEAAIRKTLKERIPDLPKIQSVNKTPINSKDVQGLSQALAQTTQTMENPMVIISADAQASHQSVMMVMEAARRNGLNQLTFAAQSPNGNAD
jgi:biopolymer transport protein ExbD